MNNITLDLIFHVASDAKRWMQKMTSFYFVASLYFTGIVTKTRGWLPMALEIWHWSVVSSIRKISPGPERRLVQSLISMSLCPDVLITYSRRGARCQS